MRRFVTLLAILTVGLIVACGGGDDDAKETATATSEGSTSSSSGSSSGSSSSSGSKDAFCTPDYGDAVFEGFDPLDAVDDLETSIEELNDLLDRWAGEAPSEIRNDVRVMVDAMKGFFEILEENDYDFFAAAMNAANDPRLAALESDEFTDAADRVAEYCGWDVDVDLGTSPSPSIGGGTSGSLGGGGFSVELPEDFPAELVPPDSTVEIAGDFGLGDGVQFTSTATVETVVDYYKDALGNPTLSSADGTIWSIIEGNKATTVLIAGSDGAVDVTVTVSTP